MARAKDLEAQVNNKKAFINEAFTNLGSKTNEIKAITADLKTLVDQYVAIIQAI